MNTIINEVVSIIKSNLISRGVYKANSDVIATELITSMINSSCSAAKNKIFKDAFDVVTKHKNNYLGIHFEESIFWDSELVLNCFKVMLGTFEPLNPEVIKPSYIKYVELLGDNALPFDIVYSDLEKLRIQANKNYSVYGSEYEMLIKSFKSTRQKVTNKTLFVSWLNARNTSSVPKRKARVAHK